jgi:hypothetical protein
MVMVVDSARFLAEVILLLWKGSVRHRGASAGVAPYGIPLNGWKVIFQAFCPS